MTTIRSFAECAQIIFLNVKPCRTRNYMCFTTFQVVYERKHTSVTCWQRLWLPHTAAGTYNELHTIFCFMSLNQNDKSIHTQKHAKTGSVFFLVSFHHLFPVAIDEIASQRLVRKMKYSNNITCLAVRFCFYFFVYSTFVRLQAHRTQCYHAPVVNGTHVS